MSASGPGPNWQAWSARSPFRSEGSHAQVPRRAASGTPGDSDRLVRPAGRDGPRSRGRADPAGQRADERARDGREPGMKHASFARRAALLAAVAGTLATPAAALATVTAN